MKKTCINPKLYRLTLEKMVIGVEEPILVKGIGEIVAKVDSGNSGYNVIHGEDLVVQGDIITFKTLNKDGVERRVSKKIKDTININIGGGHIQERPVVELDVQFGGEDYKKVQFSITNRGDNEHKVLISKDFVGKELDALIDVTKDNISGDNINVDYVTEGIMKSVGKAMDTFAHGTVAGKNKLAELEARTKALAGEGTNPTQSGIVDPKLKDEVEAIGNLKKQMEADRDLIKKQLATQKEKLNDLNVPVEGENIDVFKVIDYTGGTFNNQEKPDKEFQERLKKALAAYKNFQSESNADKLKRQQKDEAEETVVKEAATPGTPAQPTANPAAAPAQSAAQQNKNADGDNKEKEEEIDPSEQIQGKEGQKDVSDMDENEVKEVLEELKNRNRAIFYIIGFKKDNDGNSLLLGKDLFGALETKVISSWNTKICQGKDWSAKAFEPFAKQIAEKVQEGAKGLFALCSGVANARNVEFFTNPGMYDGSADNDADNAEDIDPEIIEEYTQLNNEYKELGGEGEISEEGIQKLIEGQGANANNPGEITPELIDEFNQLNQEYMAIAEDMQAQPGDYIKPEDLQALIELAMESAEDKRQNEIAADGENEASTYDYENNVESEETKI